MFSCFTIKHKESKYLTPRLCHISNNENTSGRHTYIIAISFVKERHWQQTDKRGPHSAGLLQRATANLWTSGMDWPRAAHNGRSMKPDAVTEFRTIGSWSSIDDDQWWDRICLIERCHNLMPLLQPWLPAEPTKTTDDHLVRTNNTKYRWWGGDCLEGMECTTHSRESSVTVCIFHEHVPSKEAKISHHPTVVNVCDIYCHRKM